MKTRSCHFFYQKDKNIEEFLSPFKRQQPVLKNIMDFLTIGLKNCGTSQVGRTKKDQFLPLLIDKGRHY